MCEPITDNDRKIFRLSNEEEYIYRETDIIGGDRKGEEQTRFVYFAEKKNSEHKYIIKMNSKTLVEIEINEKKVNSTMNEIRCLRDFASLYVNSMDPDNDRPLLAHFATITAAFRCSNNVYIVMPRVAGCNLKEELLSLQHPPSARHPHAKQIFKQLIKTLEYLMEEFSCSHLDLKPENIMYNRTSPEDCFITLIDFGSCTRVPDNILRSRYRFGTKNFMAPELFAPAPCSLVLSKIDVWAAGMIFFILMQPLHWNRGRVINNHAAVQKMDFDTRVQYYEKNNMSSMEAKLCASMLEIDISKRYSLDDILDSDYFMTS